MHTVIIIATDYHQTESVQNLETGKRVSRDAQVNPTVQYVFIYNPKMELVETFDRSAAA